MVALAAVEDSGCRAQAAWLGNADGLQELCVTCSSRTAGPGSSVLWPQRNEYSSTGGSWEAGPSWIKCPDENTAAGSTSIAVEPCLDPTHRRCEAMSACVVNH